MFQLHLIRPTETLFTGQVERLFVRTINGQLCLLTNHFPLVTALDVGDMYYIINNVKTVFVAVGGILLATQDGMYILTSEAYFVDKLNEERLSRLQDRLNALISQTDSKIFQNNLRSALKKVLLWSNKVDHD